MEIEVKEPSTGALLKLSARSENYKGQHGFRIFHPNGSSFFILSKYGSWRSGDDHHVEPEFLVNIGLALEGGEFREQEGKLSDHDH